MAEPKQALVLVKDHGAVKADLAGVPHQGVGGMVIRLAEKDLEGLGKHVKSGALHPLKPGESPDQAARDAAGAQWNESDEPVTFGLSLPPDAGR